ncbi:MAG: hypothetical protein IJP68_02515 [Selenomonadaceae bacterium]|nr:hypothetical protein [Selenomonadaceae bacterium]
MKLNNEVQNALTVLRANAENNFERHRLDVLERDLINPPRQFAMFNQSGASKVA